MSYTKIASIKIYIKELYLKLDLKDLDLSDAVNKSFITFAFKSFLRISILNWWVQRVVFIFIMLNMI